MQLDLLPMKSSSKKNTNRININLIQIKTMHCCFDVKKSYEKKLRIVQEMYKENKININTSESFYITVALL